MEILYVLIPEWDITCKLGQNSAKFSKYSKKAKQSDCRQIFTICPKEGHVPNPGSDTWFSNEVERKIHIRIDILLQRD